MVRPAGFFPVDAETLRYMRMTGRTEDQIALTETYSLEQGLFREDSAPEPIYTDTLELDLSRVEPSVAGPKRPQDRIKLSEVASSYAGPVGNKEKLDHGSIVIAAITSCTNTSNPSVMIAAGLVARNAAKLGLKPKPWVKTSLSPGSRVVTAYLKKAGLMSELGEGRIRRHWLWLYDLHRQTPARFPNPSSRKSEKRI